jgi:hypothetical protein
VGDRLKNIFRSKFNTFQVFPVGHIQPVADGQDLWSAHLLLPPLCHLYGVSYLQTAQVRDVAKTVTLRQQDLLTVESEWDELKILSGLNCGQVEYLL